MRTRGIAVGAIAISVLTFTGDALACFNVTKAEVDAQTKKVQAAVKALDSEDLATARRLSSEAVAFLDNARNVHEDGKLRDLKGNPVDPPDPSLRRRAYRAHALAISRLAKSTAEERERSLRDFESEVLASSDSATEPTLVADHAELLSRIPARALQGAMMLRALAAKDLLGSYRGWLALAHVEKDAKNADAEKSARERCRNAAIKKAICDS